MRHLLVLLLILLTASVSAGAAELKEIELTDGSVLTGEVLSLVNGVYTVRTSSLGTVTVPDSRVKAVRAPGSGTSVAPPAADISSLTEKMMADGDVMNMIESLRNDPAFQKALEDPEIRRAVSSGDTAALMANPKFLELMNNTTVKDIQKKVQK